MKRKKPSFDDSYYGYRTFTHLLEEADNLALIDIERNPKSGTYVVTRVGEEAPKELHRASAPPAAVGLPHKGGRERSRDLRPEPLHLDSSGT